MNARTKREKAEEIRALIPASWWGRDVITCNAKSLSDLGSENLRLLKTAWAIKHNRTKALIDEKLARITRECSMRDRIHYKSLYYIKGLSPQSEDDKAWIIGQGRPQRATASRNIRLIEQILEQNPEKKPVVVNWRTVNHFKRGEKVVILVPDRDKYLEEKRGTVVFGKVIDNTIPEDRRNATVSILLEEPVMKDASTKRSIFLLKPRSYNLLKEWEYEYLASHPSYLDIWLAGYDKQYPEISPYFIFFS